MENFLETARTISLFLLPEADRVEVEGHLQAGLISIEWWCCVLFELLKKVSSESAVDEESHEHLTERTVEVCQQLIEIVGFDLLRLDLSYISAELLKKQDPIMGRNLLEIVIGVGRELGLPHVQLPALPKPGPKRKLKSNTATPLKTPESLKQLTSFAKPKAIGNSAKLINDIPETAPANQVKPFLSVAQIKHQKRKELLQTQTNEEIRGLKEVGFGRKPDIIETNGNGRVVLPHAPHGLINKVRDTYGKAMSEISRSSSCSSFGVGMLDAVEKNVKGSIDKYTELANLILPGVDVPDSVKNQLLKHETSKIRSILQNAALDRKIFDIKAKNDIKAATLKLPEIVEREIETEKRIETLRKSRKSNQVVRNILHNRRLQTMRLGKFLVEAEDQTKAILARRRHEEERLISKMMKEALQIERNNLWETKRDQKQRNEELRKIGQLHNEARKTYIKDQVEILMENLRNLKTRERIQQNEEIEVSRRMKREDKENLRYDVRSSRSQIKVDGSDLYFRELDTNQYYCLSVTASKKFNAA